VVSVALQLPESEAQGIPNGRLTDKFPSTTTLWLVLRKFETGVAGSGGLNKNLTARGSPSTEAGAGRLYYQQPVLQVLNRELSSFTDLQKNLAQLGLNSGSALMRLGYRATETPLEEAILKIQQYFDSVDGTHTTQSQTQATPTAASDQVVETTQAPEPSHSIPPTSDTTQNASSDTDMTEPPSQLDGITQTTEPLSPSTSRPLSVFRPPSSSTPSAALVKHNDADYTPTVEHAQVHQKMLNQSSRNVRLPTEAELAQQAEAEAEKLAAIKEVEIKIRFPDQSAVSTKFGQEDSGKTLHSFVRNDCLEQQYSEQPFILRNPGVKPGQKGDTIPDSEKKLIKDLQLRGRVLVIFGWEDGASLAARGAKSVLKEELRQVAEDIRVVDVAASGVGEEEQGVKVNVGRKEDKAEGEVGGVGKKLPKWLKGLGKK
jgi:tether containing UBX domain for GLUT4